jgi:hypothetical protein
MRQNGMVIILLSTIVLFSAGCQPEPGIDKGKFSEINRTMRNLKTSLTSSNLCDAPDTLLQRLASGTADLKEKATTKGESDLVEAYSRLLTTYQDGLLFCQYRNQLSQFQFVPKGRIYVFQELDPLVQKYGFATKSHLYKPTGVYWKSIEGDSIKVIWNRAELQIKNIENMVNYY